MKVESSKNIPHAFNSRFEALVENGMDCVIILSETAETTYVSRSITHILGYTVEESMKMDMMEFVHPDHVERVKVTMGKALEHPGVPIQGHLSRVKHKNGSWVWIDAVITNMLHDPAINGIVDNFRDVTDRVLAERKANETNERLQLATQNAKIGIWELKGNTVVWDDTMYQLFGVKRDDFDGSFSSWLDIIHPSDRERIKNQVIRLIEKDTEFDEEFKLIHPDGSVRFIRSRGNIQQNVNGESIRRVIGTDWDITERKLAEADILRKNQLLSITEKISKIGNWQWNLSTNEVKWSPNLYRIYELDLNEEITYESYFQFVHPYDKERVGNNLNKAIEKKEQIDIVYRILMPDDRVKSIKTLAELIVDDQGKVIEIIGTCQDITEQKTIENDLIRKNNLLNIAEKITQIGNWQWDVKSDVVKWSTNLYHIFRVEVDTLLEFDSYFSFVYPEDKEKVTEHFNKSLNDKVFYGFVHRILLKDGTIKTIELLAEIMTDAQGNVTEMIGTCQDVTQQRVIENKFRGLLESAPDALVILNEKNSIELVNSETERMFGHVKSELIGQDSSILLPAKFQKRVNNYKKAIQNSEINDKHQKSSDLVAFKKDGTEFPIEINLGTLHTDDGILVSAAIRDITVRKQSEVMLRKMAALKAKNEDMEQLAYITSHDLREPLLTMRKYSEVLHQNFNDSLGPDGKILLETIIRSANRMEEKIKDLLEYSQLGQVKELEVVNCNDIVRVVVEDLNAQIEKKEAEITIADLPNQIKAYSTELQLIFQNLINNAIKFTEKNKAPQVHISSKKIPDGWEFQVRDNGIGIQKKDHEKIFAFFQRLHNVGDFEGSGIGLAQVKKLIELHNGHIGVQSKLGNGTTFTFSIITENL